jgi:hypothetical protein
MLNKPFIYLIAAYFEKNPAKTGHFGKYMLDYSTFTEGITFVSGHN